MKKWFGLIVAPLLILSIPMLFLVATRAQASSSGGIVIAQVQAGATGAATQEYVSLYNNGDEDIDVTGWCVRYNGSSARPGCITPPDSQTRLILTARSYTTFASTQFVGAHPGFEPQARTPFSAGLSDTAGTLTIVDTVGTIHDTFSWSARPTTGTIYQRTIDKDGQAQGSDDNAADFTQVELAFPEPLGLYEYVPPQDFCNNIAGIQPTVPDGLVQDDNSDCWEDICINLEGLQRTVPDGYRLDGELCREIPKQSARIDITELLPNPASYDTGNEFIELFNPNDSAISLEGYVLQLGPGFTKSHIFPDIVLEPRSYQAFSDKDTGIVLPNTKASLRLVAPAGNVVSLADAYEKPSDDLAWALIDGTWQFTDRLTPGAANIAASADIKQLLATGLAPCPEGKYRNPDTNRCRNIATADSSLKPCAADQYRNPETNRCRKLSALSGSTLTPCKPGQERNPATNRCRSTASASSNLKPCEPGQERNPDTNRCRKVLSATANRTDDPDQSRSGNTLLMILMIALTAGYALYEYRHDIANLYLRHRVRQQHKAG